MKKKIEIFAFIIIIIARLAGAFVISAESRFCRAIMGLVYSRIRIKGSLGLRLGCNYTTLILAANVNFVLPQS